MPTAKEVQEQIEKLRLSTYVMTEGVNALMPIILTDGEVIAKAVGADSGWDYGESFGAFIATNKRMMLVVSASPGNSTTDSFWYNDIVSILVRNTRGNNARRDIVIYDGVNETAITGIFEGEAQDFMDFVLSNLNLIEKERNGMPYFGIADMGALNEMPVTQRYVLRKKVGAEFVYATKLSWIKTGFKTPFVDKTMVSSDSKKAFLLTNGYLDSKSYGRTARSLINEHLKDFSLVERQPNESELPIEAE